MLGVTEVTIHLTVTLNLTESTAVQGRILPVMSTSYYPLSFTLSVKIINLLLPLIYFMKVGKGFPLLSVTV